VAYAGIFFDRHGVLTVGGNVGGYPTSPRSLDEFKIDPEAKIALRRISLLSIPMVCVTNQPDIARGLLTQETADVMTRQLIAGLPLDRVEMCPHDSNQCACR
jgi:D-glycero-D-manno-heptose 1,7-bisphosphate phosphatase